MTRSCSEKCKSNSDAYGQNFDIRLKTRRTGLEGYIGRGFYRTLSSRVHCPPPLTEVDMVFGCMMRATSFAIFRRRCRFFSGGFTKYEAVLEFGVSDLMSVGPIGLKFTPGDFRLQNGLEVFLLLLERNMGFGASPLEVNDFTQPG